MDVLFGVVCLFLISIPVFFLYRNSWLYKTLSNTNNFNDFQAFISSRDMTIQKAYDYLLYRRFWVWNAKKLLNPNQPKSK